MPGETCGLDVKRIKFENKSHLEERNELPSTKGRTKVDFASGYELRLPHRTMNVSRLFQLNVMFLRKVKAEGTDQSSRRPSFYIKTTIKNVLGFFKFCKTLCLKSHLL